MQAPSAALTLPFGSPSLASHEGEREGEEEREWLKQA